jgi:purine nucleosidase
MWGDVDDVLALAMLHALERRGEARLLAVTSSTEDRSTASFIAKLNAFYGRGDIPVGMVRGGVTPAQTVQRFPFLGKDKGYTQALTRGIGHSVPEAVALLRKALAAQPDGSVVVVAVGFSTNLARLLESKGDATSPLDGMVLVRRKVRSLSIMAGSFDGREGEAEYNLILDVPSAQRLFDRWPTPLVASGSEIGRVMRIDGARVERDYGYAADHPVAAAYRYADRFYRTLATPAGMLNDRGTYDLTSVLYAVRPNDGYFNLSTPGRIRIDGDGSSRFVTQAEGTHRHLVMTDAQRERTLEAMTLLASAPPSRRAGGRCRISR